MSHIKKSRFISKERRGWRVLDILSNQKGEARTSETFTKTNPNEMPYTRQGGMRRKAGQGT